MKTEKRLHYIDWLRVLAFITLILFHCAVPFVEHYHWEINSEKTHPGLPVLCGGPTNGGSPYCF